MTLLRSSGASQGAALPFTTASGQQVDLYKPQRDTLSLRDMAEHVAKETRYNGATPGTIYFVGQHTVLGVDEILSGRDPRDFDFSAAQLPVHFADTDCDREFLAAYFLCHDLKEAYLGDDTTPKKRALDKVAEECGDLAGGVSESFARLEERFDAGIHAEAGLAWPPLKPIAEYVALVDKRMLVTEWRDLMPGRGTPRGSEGIPPFAFTIDPWPWERGMGHTLALMQRLLPGFRSERVVIDELLDSAERRR